MQVEQVINDCKLGTGTTEKNMGFVVNCMPCGKRRSKIHFLDDLETSCRQAEDDKYVDRSVWFFSLEPFDCYITSQLEKLLQRKMKKIIFESERLRSEVSTGLQRKVLPLYSQKWILSKFQNTKLSDSRFNYLTVMTIMSIF